VPHRFSGGGHNEENSKSTHDHTIGKVPHRFSGGGHNEGNSKSTHDHTIGSNNASLNQMNTVPLHTLPCLETDIKPLRIRQTRWMNLLKESPHA
jgi:hypothetical protein